MRKKTQHKNEGQKFSARSFCRPVSCDRPRCRHEFIALPGHGRGLFFDSADYSLTVSIHHTHTRDHQRGAPTTQHNDGLGGQGDARAHRTSGLGRDRHLANYSSPHTRTHIAHTFVRASLNPCIRFWCPFWCVVFTRLCGAPVPWGIMLLTRKFSRDSGVAVRRVGRALSADAARHGAG